MRGTNNILISDFYCTQCGNKGINIWRKRGNEREAGHLKKIWCFHCNKEVNFCEIKPNTMRYTYDDFKTEYEYGNFNEEGNRIMKYGELRRLIHNGQIEKQKTLSDVRDPGDRQVYMAPAASAYVQRNN